MHTSANMQVNSENRLYCRSFNTIRSLRADATPSAHAGTRRRLKPNQPRYCTRQAMRGVFVSISDAGSFVYSSSSSVIAVSCVCVSLFRFLASQSQVTRHPPLAVLCRLIHRLGLGQCLGSPPVGVPHIAQAMLGFVLSCVVVALA